MRSFIFQCARAFSCPSCHGPLGSLLHVCTADLSWASERDLGGAFCPPTWPMIKCPMCLRSMWVLTIGRRNSYTSIQLCWLIVLFGSLCLWSFLVWCDNNWERSIENSWCDGRLFIFSCCGCQYLIPVFRNSLQISRRFKIVKFSY